MARTSTYYYETDLGGIRAELVLHSTVMGAHHASEYISGRITSVAVVGSRVYTQGTLTSATAHYTFSGENTFAEFSHRETGERFKVQFQTDDERGGIWMIANPFGPGKPTEYFCRTLRVVEHGEG